MAPGGYADDRDPTVYLHRSIFWTFDHLIQKSTKNQTGPQGDGLGSVLTCMPCEMHSRSDRSSDSFLVPRTFLKVVWASN